MVSFQAVFGESIFVAVVAGCDRVRNRVEATVGAAAAAVVVDVVGCADIDAMPDDDDDKDGN